MIPIYETFHAFQGEGSHMGKNAFFIRSYGCPVKCNFCDSAGTWHKDWSQNKSTKYSEKELANIIIKESANLTIITGGEPAIFDWSEVINLVKESTPKVENNSLVSNSAKKVENKIHLETSGGFEVKGGFDWITMSPKIEAPIHAPILRSVDELKIIVTGPDSINQWNDLYDAVDDIPIWLHPEWSQRNNPVILRAITDAIKYGDSRFRAGYQLHKLYSCDSLDERSRPLVPLGGDINNGY